MKKIILILLALMFIVSVAIAMDTNVFERNGDKDGALVILPEVRGSAEYFAANNAINEIVNDETSDTISNRYAENNESVVMDLVIHDGQKNGGSVLKGKYNNAIIGTNNFAYNYDGFNLVNADNTGVMDLIGLDIVMMEDGDKIIKIPTNNIAVETDNFTGKSNCVANNDDNNLGWNECFS